MLKRHRGERGHRHSQVGTSRCRLETFHPRAPRLPRAGSRAVPAGWYIGKVRAGGGHDVHAATAQQQPQQHDGGRSQHGHRDACPPHARQTPRWATVGSEGTDGRCRRVNLSGRTCAAAVRAVWRVSTRAVTGCVYQCAAGQQRGSEACRCELGVVHLGGKEPARSQILSCCGQMDCIYTSRQPALTPSGSTRSPTPARPSAPSHLRCWFVRLTADGVHPLNTLHRPGRAPPRPTPYSLQRRTRPEALTGASRAVGVRESEQRGMGAAGCAGAAPRRGPCGIGEADVHPATQ